MDALVGAAEPAVRNAAAHAALVADLRERLASARLGGGECHQCSPSASGPSASAGK